MKTKDDNVDIKIATERLNNPPDHYLTTDELKEQLGHWDAWQVDDKDAQVYTTQTPYADAYLKNKERTDEDKSITELVEDIKQKSEEIKDIMSITRGFCK